MQLEDGALHLRGDRAEAGSLEGRRLILAADHHQHLLRLHDRLNAHRVCLTRHIVYGSEESLVRLDRRLRQVNAVCLRLKYIARLIETDMAGAADA